MAYGFFIQIITLAMNLLLTGVTCTPLAGVLTPRLYFFYRERGFASPGAELLLWLANNGIMVMAARPLTNFRESS